VSPNHKHSWGTYILGSEALIAFRFCPGCNAREACPVPADYPRGVPTSAAPAYILPDPDGAQLSLWEEL
jgi:hypothetical protein